MASQADIRWSRNLFDSLYDGGRWGIPRSGLIFQKRGERFHLVSAMPFTREMADAAAKGADVPPTPEALRRYQRADFDHIASVFEAAGIPVVDDVFSVDGGS